MSVYITMCKTIANFNPCTVIAYGTEIIPLPRLVEVTANAPSITDRPVGLKFQTCLKSSPSSSASISLFF